MSYDIDYKCKSCGAVGLNELDVKEGWVYCECGECLFQVERDEHEE